MFCSFYTPPVVSLAGRRVLRIRSRDPLLISNEIRMRIGVPIFGLNLYYGVLLIVIPISEILLSDLNEEFCYRC